MRIDEPTTMAGYFWLPTTPEKKLGGTLQVYDGGILQIEVVGNFDSSLEDFSKLDIIPRILGEVEKLGYITLDDCLYKTKNMSLGSVGKSMLYCHRAFAGIHFESSEQAEFDRVSFHVEGLDEWLGISGIKMNREEGGHGFSLTYERPTLPEIVLGEGFVLKFGFSYTLPGFPLLTEASIRQQAGIIIESSERKHLNSFISQIHKLTKFLGFAIDKIVSIKDFKASINIPESERVDDLLASLEAKVFYQSLPFSQSKPKISWHSLLFSYKHIDASAAQKIQAWMLAYDTIGPPLDLYFAAISDAAKYIDSKFLFLAQALETWHRRESDTTEMDASEFESIVAALIASCPQQRQEWLRGRLTYANEISLAKRLSELLAPFESFLPDGIELKRIIRLIVDTRNYLTHYNPSLEGRAARGRDLFDLVDRMEAFFKLLLLTRIGFTPEDVTALTAENWDFQHKMKKA